MASIAPAVRVRMAQLLYASPPMELEVPIITRTDIIADRMVAA
jgi:hypothetical protein